MTTDTATGTRSALDYNKVWAALVTLGILLVLEYVGLDLHTVLEGAALIFAVERTPNGRVPLRSQSR